MNFFRCPEGIKVLLFAISRSLLTSDLAISVAWATYDNDDFTPRSDWSGLFSLRSLFTEETKPGFTEKTTIVGHSFAKRSYRSARSFDSMLDSFWLPLHPSI